MIRIYFFLLTLSIMYSLKKRKASSKTQDRSKVLASKQGSTGRKPKFVRGSSDSSTYKEPINEYIV